MTRLDVESNRFDRWGSVLWQPLASIVCLHACDFLFPGLSARSIVATALLCTCIVPLDSGICRCQELITITRRIEGAQLKSIGRDFAIFQTSGGELRVPMVEIVSWGSLREPTRYEWLCLRNGSLIAGSCSAFEKDHIIWHNDELGDLQVPVNQAAGIIFRLPGLIPEKDLLFDRILRGSATGFVLLANGDQLDGRLLRREGNGDLVVATRFGERTFGPEQIQAVSVPGGPVVEKEPCQLAAGLEDGSRIIITKPSKNPASSSGVPVEAASVEGGEQALLWSLIKTHSQHICFLQGFDGVVYLSDMKPESFIAVPFLDYVWGFKEDRNVMGGWLRAGNRGYLKGIGTYSACRIRYALTGQFRQFATEVAIDASAGKKGSVVCHVLVDGQRKASVGPIRGGEPPVPIILDVSGAKDLDLVVDFGEWADECDYTNWLNARLIPVARSDNVPRQAN